MSMLAWISHDQKIDYSVLMFHMQIFLIEIDPWLTMLYYIGYRASGHYPPTI